MSKTKHTPGPWTWSYNEANELKINAEKYEQRWARICTIAKPEETSVLNREMREANAARIVACVNAMEGIDDPSAARVVLDLPQTQHANEMLEALKAIQDVTNYPATISESALFDLIGKCGEIAAAAIAKVEWKKS